MSTHKQPTWRDPRLTGLILVSVLAFASLVFLRNSGRTAEPSEPSVSSDQRPRNQSADRPERSSHLAHSEENGEESRSLAPRFDDPEPEIESEGVDLSNEARRLLWKLMHEGYSVTEQDLAGEHYSDIKESWDRLSEEVRRQKESFDAAMRSFARPRFESGQFESFYYDPNAQQGDRERDPRMQGNPNAYVRRRYTFDPEMGRPVCQIVNVFPGEDADVDVTHEAYQRALRDRRDAMMQLLGR